LQARFFLLDLDLDLDLDLPFLKKTWTRTWTCPFKVDLDLDLDLAVAGLVTSLLIDIHDSAETLVTTNWQKKSKTTVNTRLITREAKL